MGLNGLPDDGGGGGKESTEVDACSICLDAVAINGDRSWARLKCGHRFHLDCIGSAFNAKGVMQCPNCRKLENGQWLYASGYRSQHEFTLDDLTHDDLFDLGYSEMSFGVHWCPFGGLARLPSGFEEGEFSSTAYNEYLGQHPMIAEHTATANNPCPYIVQFRPLHPSSSTSSGSVPDVSNFNNHWNGASVPNEIAYAFPDTDVHYQNWDHHHSSPFSTNRGGPEQSSIQPITVSQRARSTTDIPRHGSFVQPFVVGHSSGARAGTSIATSMVPPYPGSFARTRHRVQALQAYYQQLGSSSPSRPPVMSTTQRSSNHRNMAQAPPPSDQNNGFYFYPSSSSVRSFQEVENPVPIHHRGREHEHLPSFAPTQVDRDSGWGGPFLQPGAGSEAAAVRAHGLRRRHGSERMPTQNRPDLI